MKGLLIIILLITCQVLKAQTRLGYNEKQIRDEYPNIDFLKGTTSKGQPFLKNITDNYTWVYLFDEDGICRTNFLTPDSKNIYDQAIKELNSTKEKIGELKWRSYYEGKPIITYAVHEDKTNSDFFIIKEDKVKQSAKESKESFCYFNTDGTGKSLGLKIQLKVPCDWNKEEGERPHAVNNFTKLTESKNAITHTISIYDLKIKLTESDIELLASEYSLKEDANKIGEYVSSRKVKMDGITVGECCVKFKRELPIGTMYMYMLMYNIYYKNKHIMLCYSVGSAYGYLEALDDFNKNKSLFRLLATSFIIKNKWTK